MNDNDYLAHYGVLGMKWGVRNDPYKAYKKATRKKVKLDVRAGKKQAKADKAQRRADKYGSNWYHQHRKAGRNRLAKMQISANKKQLSADRAARKAEEWLSEMEEVFSDTPLSDIKKN